MKCAQALSVAVFLLAAMATSTRADPLFSAPFLSFDTGNRPTSVAVSDLDGDGRPDMAVANVESGNVSVLLGKGDGTFGAKTDVGAGSYSFSVALADLNADGRPDMAVANSRSNTVSVTLGNGDGTFGIQTDFGAGIGPNAVAIADLNADSRPDLVVANLGSATVSVLLGNGDGTFADKTDFDTGVGPCSVTAADFDADGQLDLAVANRYSNTVSVLLGNGDGALAARTDFHAGVVPYSVAAGHLNSDERLDLAVANHFSSTVSVLLGNGDGTFAARTDFGTGSAPSSVAIADLNADDRSDLAVANFGFGDGYTVSILLGTGDGGFAAKTDFITGNGPSSVAAEDLNTDGRLDLVVVNHFPSTVSVLLGNGDGTLGAGTDFGAGGGPRCVAVADLNEDGRQDLAVANLSSHTVSVLLGEGDGTFGARIDFGAGGFPSSLAIADLNADGRPDLAVANSIFGVGGTVSVLLGNGDGTFAARTDFGTGSAPSSVAIADFNADGRPDVAVANHGYGVGSTVSVLLGNGDGTFAGKTDFGAGAAPWSVAVADLNADGRQDLAVVNRDSHRVSVLLGNGDGTFRARTEFGTGRYPNSVTIADFNADGRLDLAVANRGQDVRSTVSVLLGNGDGTYAEKTDFGTGGHAVSVATADLNSDGRPDLAVANWLQWTVSVLLGNGDGTFSARTDFGAGSGLSSVAIGELNGDGRPDLATANHGSNTVSVLLNRGGTPVAMGFDLTPNTLNLASRGAWVTGFLQPRSPLAAGDVAIESIRLNGRVTVDPAGSTALGDHDGDGISDLMVKFDRAAVEPTLSEGDNVPVTVTGTVDGRPFSGTDYIRVRRTVVSVSATGDRLAAGSVIQVCWQSPSGPGARPVALLYSPDSGNTWTLIADGQPSTGSYDWLVPNVHTEHVRVAVGVVESAEEANPLEERVLGVSEELSIEGVVGVGDRGSRASALGLRAASPSSGDRLRLEFELRDGSPARLDLLDVAGRLLSSMQVEALGPGTHVRDLPEGGTLRVGVYFLRLTQGGTEVRTRVAVIR